MLVSYEWLQSFFDGKLPTVDEVVEALTFHAWEVEGVEKVGEDDVVEVSILPDTAAWALSHRGVAKNLSVILDLSLARDPFAETVSLLPKSEHIAIDIKASGCDRYTAVCIDGVSVGPSPGWLKRRIEAIGQKSINNIVDATNYVMFELGQPLHAFDLHKLGGGEYAAKITVRNAEANEQIVSLTGEEYSLGENDMLIVDGHDNKPIGIAGIKGGKNAEVTKETTALLIESAHFDAIAVRKTSQRLRLRTDASQRFENGIVPKLTEYGIAAIAELIIDIAGGEVKGYADSDKTAVSSEPVSLTLSELNMLLGVQLSIQEVISIIERFGYIYKVDGETLIVEPPFERTDMRIPADLVEEIGRIYGYTHIQSCQPEKAEVAEVNKQFYYTEKVRQTLATLGFSEILTSSFRKKDTVKLANALASDKGYLRSSLRENHNEALEKNRVNADLLGLPQIQTFEIGTVFTDVGAEHAALVLGVRSPTGYKPKQDDPVLANALEALAEQLGVSKAAAAVNAGIAEIDLSKAIEALGTPGIYETTGNTEAAVTYRPFSPYPFITRDIALWVDAETTAGDVEQIVNDAAGDLRVRTTLFDEFAKDGRVSYAFRLVFQSDVRTLTDGDVEPLMNAVYSAVEAKGWEVR